MAKSELLDVAIIGAGPSGLTAGIYARRAMLDVAVFEKFFVGGQVNLTDMIENYPGFAEGISGMRLVEDMHAQAKAAGVNIIVDEVVSISKCDKGACRCFEVATKSGKKYGALSVIIATGANPRHLAVEGEDRLKGKGISYCAICDGPLYKDKEVAVIGGGDKALEEALYLSRICRKVSLVHRRGQLRAAKVLQERAVNDKKIKLELKQVLVEITGDDKVESLKLKNVEDSSIKEVPCQGVFIAIGMEPNAAFIKGLVELDENGYIKTDENMRASAEGIFACGDVRSKNLRQVVTACGDGALASFICQQYLERLA